MNTAYLIHLAVLVCLISCSKTPSQPEPEPGPVDPPREYTEYRRDGVVNIESLLREMTDLEGDPYMPAPYYTAKMVSSTDARSVSPDQPYWFANTDNSRYVRMEGGKKVIFEEEGPGAITRIWTVGKVNYGMCFYFDGETSPRIVFSNFDPSNANWRPESPLMFRHVWYDQYSGSNLYYPIPYAKSLKIVAETSSTNSAAFHISCRKYEEGTTVESFEVSKARSLANLASEIAQTLATHPSYEEGVECKTQGTVSPGGSISLDLPKGECAVRNLVIRAGKFDSSAREEMLRSLSVRMHFDGYQTVDVPLSYLTGGGLTSAAVDSWYVTANGTGTCEWRFVMPWRDSARIEVINRHASLEPKILLQARVDTDFEWHTNSLYFHADYHYSEKLPLSNDYLSDNVREWTAVNLQGGGIVKGDALSVRCHSNTWYGEGDEKIWIDDDSFPSFFGTGTEDYYNTSFAPVVEFQNAFGGSVHVDSGKMPFVNTWMRTRNLDGMTFRNSLRHNWELESWETTTADYSTVVWWYGPGTAKNIEN